MVVDAAASKESLSGAQFNNNKIEPSVCAGKPHNHLVADPDDCKSFYLCRNELPFKETCSESFWFDPVRLVCALPGEKPFCMDLVCKGKNNVFDEDPFQCGKYHICKNGEISYSGTCNDDLVFVQETQSCTYPLCSEINGSAEAPAIQPRFEN